MSLLPRLAVSGVFAAAVFAVSPALADRIDGDWCFAGKSMTINGPKIVTPGGNTITGDYGRHDFKYTVPASETGAGDLVDMRLINDDNAEVRVGKDGPQVWRRCRVTS